MHDEHNVTPSDVSRDRQGEDSLVSPSDVARLYDELLHRDDRIEELEAINRELWRRIDAQGS